MLKKSSGDSISPTSPALTLRGIRAASQGRVLRDLGMEVQEECL